MPGVGEGGPLRHLPQHQADGGHLQGELRRLRLPLTLQQGGAGEHSAQRITGSFIMSRLLMICPTPIMKKTISTVDMENSTVRSMEKIVMPMKSKRLISLPLLERYQPVQITSVELQSSMIGKSSTTLYPLKT